VTVDALRPAAREAIAADRDLRGRTAELARVRDLGVAG
jgi:hypothetical protein